MIFHAALSALLNVVLLAAIPFFAPADVDLATAFEAAQAE